MTHAEILEELKRLTLTERLAVVETALQLIRADLQHMEQPADRDEQKRQLTAAAEELRADYEADGELTAFTALDGEDFHA